MRRLYFTEKAGNCAMKVYWDNKKCQWIGVLFINNVKKSERVMEAAEKPTARTVAMIYLEAEANWIRPSRPYERDVWMY